MSGYCERLDGSFWAEPLNAVTNAAFIVAALLAAVIWRREARGDAWTGLLVLFTFAIGIGSFLFHTMPGPVTLAADVVPIQLFALGTYLLAMRRYLGLRWPLAIGSTVLFVAATVALPLLLREVAPQAVRGVAGYGMFVIALFGVAAALVPRAPWQSLAVAGLVFAVSLTMRALDPVLCNAWPHGTHFLWHVLNAVVLFILLRAAIRHGVRA